ASMASLLTLNVGGFVNQVLGQEGLDIIQSGQTEAAFLKAMNQPWDQLISAAQRLTSGTAKQASEDLEPATALADDSQTDEASSESSEVTQEAKSEAQDSSAGASNKTSIETYKSMIENISEQLLPQTGLLNLTSPKVPKARTRKTKEESKKSAPSDNESGSNNES
ncbi:MAG TPA: ribonuclease, partial [Psychrobacter pasteurii]|nr:ribonuclease [Psychrobacter pasteurii]